MDKDDAEPMRTYINKLSKEQTFITYQGEEVTVEEERERRRSYKNGEGTWSNSFL